MLRMTNMRKLSSFKKTAHLSFFGQALNNTSERNEVKNLNSANKEILRYAQDDKYAFLAMLRMAPFTFPFSVFRFPFFYLPFPTKSLSMYSKNLSLYISPMGT